MSERDIKRHTANLGLGDFLSRLDRSDVFALTNMKKACKKKIGEVDIYEYKSILVCGSFKCLEIYDIKGNHLLSFYGGDFEIGED